MIQIKQIGKKIANVLSVAIVVIEVIVIAMLILTKINGDVPSIFGYSFYVIVSPSMSPELEVGDMIISKKYDGGELEVGDIVEYVGQSGDMAGKIITHKIVKITGEGADRVIVTRGTANNTDDAPISPSNIIAVMKYKTVIIDKIYSVLCTTAGFICLVLLPMVAMIVSEVVRLGRELQKEAKGGGKNEK